MEMDSIELTAVGGYSEIGKNMTAVKVGNDVVILDMGVDLEPYIKVQDEREGIEKVSVHELISIKAIPDDAAIADWKDKVRAIACSHAHLDHVGAVPFLAGKYHCPILGTQYTVEMIKRICADNRLKITNKCTRLPLNNSFRVSPETSIELLNSQHSLPQTALVLIKHKSKKIVYANEYKFDPAPIIGSKMNEKELAKLGPIDVLISDCIYANEPIKMPSESVVREMIRDVFSTDFGASAVFITTFASHLARLKSIVQQGKQTGRKIIVLGRSFQKYIETAEKINLVHFGKDITLYPYGPQVRKKLKEVARERHKYIVVLTGHQGEPNALLARITRDELPFKFRKGDFVIFCSKVIPTKTNQEARQKLERGLNVLGTNILDNIHISGHGAREDMRRMITLLKPRHLVPCHAPRERQKHFADIAFQQGYTSEQVHFLKNGERVRLV